MSQQYDNTNSGILTANDNRRNDKDPSHQGSINIDGKEFWLSAWVNTGKEGSKLAGKRYFSIKAKPKMASEHKGGTNNPPARTHASSGDEFDDDVSF